VVGVLGSSARMGSTGSRGRTRCSPRQLHLPSPQPSRSICMGRPPAKPAAQVTLVHQHQCQLHSDLCLTSSRSHSNLIAQSTGRRHGGCDGGLQVRAFIDLIVTRLLKAREGGTAVNPAGSPQRLERADNPTARRSAMLSGQFGWLRGKGTTAGHLGAAKLGKQAMPTSGAWKALESLHCMYEVRFSSSGFAVWPARPSADFVSETALLELPLHDTRVEGV